MKANYQARWISKPRVDAIRKNGDVRRGVVLDTFKGFLIIEPAGAKLGDGKALTTEEAEYELQPVWCLEPKTKLLQARKLLALEQALPVGIS